MGVGETGITGSSYFSVVRTLLYRYGGVRALSRALVRHKVVIGREIKNAKI